MQRCRVLRFQAHPDENLLHMTTRDKARAINMVGLRVGPRTKRATGYCARDDYDCMREEAYRRSEEHLERVRGEVEPGLPSRTNAVFFMPGEGSAQLDEPEAFLVDTEYDDRGRLRPIYDFGFGRSDLFVVDADIVDASCRCGSGDNILSDEVFEYYLDELRGRATRGDPEGKARKFWGTAELWDPVADISTEHEMTEIWCPCHIPREAIRAWYGSHNPVPDWKGRINYVWDKG